jgi:hypothetical protein
MAVVTIRNPFIPSGANFRNIMDFPRLFPAPALLNSRKLSKFSTYPGFDQCIIAEAVRNIPNAFSPSERRAHGPA